MRLALLTATAQGAWEADLVAACGRGEVPLTVVRRCMDVADLLAAARAGLGAVAAVDARLPRLDRYCLEELTAAGLGVVVVVAPQDPAAVLVRRFAPWVLETTEGTGRLAETLLRAATHPGGPEERSGSTTPGRLSADGPSGSDRAAATVPPRPAALVQPRPDAMVPTPSVPGEAGRGSRLRGGPAHRRSGRRLVGRAGAGSPADDGGGRSPGPVAKAGRIANVGRGAPSGPSGPGGPGGPSDRGAVVAVWGPTGAPGRTSVAVGVSTELARLGLPALLVDADPYSGAVAITLGLGADSPGLAAACRAANVGELTPALLAGLCRDVAGLRVLPGIPRARRWPDIAGGALGAVLETARALAGVTVVDCGFCLERDEELSYDTVAPRRNSATLAALAAADLILAVGRADALGLVRLAAGLEELRELLPDARVEVVANQVRGSRRLGPASAEVSDAIERHLGTAPRVVIPADPAAFAEALRTGSALAEATPRSPARTALVALAAGLAGVPPPGRRAWRQVLWHRVVGHRVLWHRVLRHRQPPGPGAASPRADRDPLTSAQPVGR